MSVFRVALVGLLGDSDETRNIFTFKGTALAIPTIAEVGAWLDTLYTTSVLSGIVDDWRTTRFIIETSDEAGHFVYTAEGQYFKQGSNTSDPLPYQMAAVVIGITPSRRRGKKFIPGIPESLVSSGVLDGGLATTLLDYGIAWATAMAGASGPYLSGVVKPPYGEANFLEFNGVRVDPIMGTQRKRKQGVGS